MGQASCLFLLSPDTVRPLGLDWAKPPQVKTPLRTPAACGLVVKRPAADWACFGLPPRNRLSLLVVQHCSTQSPIVASCSIYSLNAGFLVLHTPYVAQHQPHRQDPNRFSPQDLRCAASVPLVLLRYLIVNEVPPPLLSSCIRHFCKGRPRQPYSQESV